MESFAFCLSSLFAPIVHNNACVIADTNPPVHLMLHFVLTRKQDPEICEPLRLGQQLSPNPGGAIYRFLVKRCLRLWGVDSHPGCLCACWRSRSHEANRATSSAKSKDTISRSQNGPSKQSDLPNINSFCGELMPLLLLDTSSTLFFPCWSDFIFCHQHRGTEQ